MKKIVLGQTTSGKPLHLDVERLVESRALLQANSGGGKSWALRRILEQAHGQCQQIVLDVEGEFHTLREKFDYVLVARTGGDTLADPRSAGLLARRLLELGVSAIVDLYELHAHERIRCVRLFLEALVDAPKDLWHPTLVVLDEAHIFCPEAGKAESAGAVIDLMTRGRKRGFGGVLATQRLSKLHKDAAAEANVKLIGRASLDVDMKRAGAELGFTKREDLEQLRRLEKGHFFAFGPGLSDEVVEVHVGEVLTTHPKAGQRATPIPPAREKVQRVLAQLADLPKEAEAEAKTAAELRVENARMKRELAAKPKPLEPAPAKVRVVERPAPLKDKIVTRLEAVGSRVENTAAALKDATDRYMQVGAEVTTALQEVRRFYSQAIQPRDLKPPQGTAPRPQPPPVPRAAAPRAPRAPGGPPTEGLGAAHRRILGAAAFLEARGETAPDQVRLALWAGMSATGGYWSNTIGRLRSMGLMEGTRLTPEGRALAEPPEIETTEQLHRHVFDNLLEGNAQRAVLQVLIDARETEPEGLEQAEVARRANLNHEGGYWANNLGRLRSLGLVSKRGPLKALPVLFLEGGR